MSALPDVCRRAWALGGLASLICAWPHTPQAQERSAQTARIVVPFAAGGLTDILARSAAEQMARHGGQPVIVDNRPGAAGHVAAELVAKGPADGSQLAMLSAGHAGGIAFGNESVRYDLLKDFTAVGMLGFSPTILVGRKALNVNDFTSLVALARAQPGSLSFAAVQSYTVEYLQAMAAVEFNLILYKGAGAAYQDMLAERVDLMVGTVADMARLVETGRYVPIAINSPARVAQFPGVASVAESIPGYRAGQWYGLFVPAAVPQPLVDRFRVSLARTVKEPGYLATLAKLAMQPPDLGVDAFAQEVADTLRSFQRARALRRGPAGAVR